MDPRLDFLKTQRSQNRQKLSYNCVPGGQFLVPLAYLNSIKYRATTIALQRV